MNIEPVAPTASRAARAVLRKIAAGDSHRASWETYQELMDRGLAEFFGLCDVDDPRDTGWRLTTLGKLVLGA